MHISVHVLKHVFYDKNIKNPRIHCNANVLTLPVLLNDQDSILQIKLISNIIGLAGLSGENYFKSEKELEIFILAISLK